MATALEFNTLLRNADIDPAEVQLMRHVPSEPSLKKILPWLAAQKPELYNAYQSVHSQRVEQFLLNPKIKYIASFIGHEPDKAVFIGTQTCNKPKKYFDHSASNALLADAKPAGRSVRSRRRLASAARVSGYARDDVATTVAASTSSRTASLPASAT